jgi:hypothetical protein
MFRPISLATSFDVPMAAFKFDGLTEEERDTLRSYGLREDLTNRGVFVGCPTETDYKKIIAMSPTDGRIPPSYVSADGYLAYMYTIKAYQIYSSLSRLVIRGTPNFVYKATDEDETADISDARQKVNVIALGETIIGTSYSRDVKDGWTNSTHAELIPQVALLEAHTTLSSGFVDSADLSTMTARPGIFFPYFGGMLNPDKSMVIHIFESLFYRGLGKDSDSASAVWSRLRPGIKNFAFTAAGRAISHLYAGIKYSTQTGTTITAILSSKRYVGFVLQGDLEVTLYGTTTRAIAWSELKLEIESVDSHTKNLDKIAAEINKLDVRRNRPALTGADINTSRKLVSMLLSIDVNDRSADFTKVVTPLLSKLSYGDRYAPLTEQSILIFLSYVHSGDESLIRSFSAYVDNGYGMLADRVHVGLGIFGPKAPSLNFTSSGKTFIIPGPDAADGNLVITEGVRRLQYLPFALEPIRVAGTQWHSLFNHGKFTIPDARKGKKEFTNGNNVQIKIGQAARFTGAYTMIKERVHMVKAEMARTGKRKLNEASGSEPRKKKAKTLKGLVDDI